MNRLTQKLLLASGIAFGVAGAALADGDGGDNGMNRFTGDSWSALGNQKAQAQPAPATAQDKPSATAQDRTSATAGRQDHATISPGVRSHPTSPFHDNTGA